MNNCLNCGKEVTNKYCGVHCQNEHKGKVNKEKYNQNPKLCLTCGKAIDYEHRTNKYCGHSCAATKNNQGVNRKINTATISKMSVFNDSDFIDIVTNALNWAEIFHDFGYQSRGGSNSRGIILERAKSLGIDINFEKDLIKDKTKKEMFELSKNWQAARAARSAIRKDACKVFENSDKEYKCVICGYTNHVEIAHIKAVSEFDDNALMTEINHIDNLVGLCPTHHWEFDAGLIDL